MSKFWGVILGAWLVVICSFPSTGSAALVGDDPRIGALIQTLTTGQEDDRIRAARDIGLLGAQAKQAVPALVGALNSNNPALMKAAEEALYEIGGPEAIPVLAHILAKTNSKDKDMQLVYLRILSRFCRAYVPDNRNVLRPLYPFLAKATMAEDADVRIQAIVVLTAAHEKRAVQRLIQLVQTDSNPLVCLEALGAMESFGPQAKEAVPALLNVLRMNKEGLSWQKGTAAKRQVAEGALRTLASIGAPAIPAISELLDDADEGIRFHGVRALGGMGEKAGKAVPAVSRTLRDINQQVREESALVLCKLGPAAKDSIPALRNALQDKSGLVRVRAATALLKLAPDNSDALPAVVNALLSEKDLEVREEAMEYLASIGPGAKAVIPVLVQVLIQVPVTSSKVEAGRMAEIRCKAARILGSLGPVAKDAVPVLIDTLNDESVFVRMCSAAALGRIGPEAKNAIPALTKASKDKSFGVRYEAERALRRIQKGER